MDSVKYLNPNYEYRLYGNESIKEFNLEKFYNNVPHAFLSNYIRIRVLQEYGGFYIDTDLELLQPLDKMLKDSNNENSTLLIPYNSYKQSIRPNTNLFGVAKEIDFSNIINEYNPLIPLLSIFRKFIEEHSEEITMLDKKYLSKESEYIVDHCFNSWSDEFNRSEQYLGFKNMLDNDKIDENLFKIISFKGIINK